MSDRGARRRSVRMHIRAASPDSTDMMEALICVGSRRPTAKCAHAHEPSGNDEPELTAAASPRPVPSSTRTMEAQIRVGSRRAAAKCAHVHQGGQPPTLTDMMEALICVGSRRPTAKCAHAHEPSGNDEPAQISASRNKPKRGLLAFAPPPPAAHRPCPGAPTAGRGRAGRSGRRPRSACRSDDAGPNGG